MLHAQNDLLEQRLDEVVTAYLEAVEAGRVPDRQEWLARHADLAEGLAAFFADTDRVRCWTDPLCQAVRDVRPAQAAGLRFGNYELLREIGRGGNGVVYEARQISLNRFVALKMVRLDQLGDEKERRRLRNEAATVALLDHPYVVPVYEVGERDGQMYFSMKLLSGGSLAGQLDRFRTQPRLAAEVVAQVARAVHHAHQRGVLHRDLKPSNILLDAEGQPHVADFGQAKRVQSEPEASVTAHLTQSGAIVGTPSYMAPEQTVSDRRAVTTAADVYGLGGTLHALLTGDPPFQGRDIIDTILQVRERAPAPLDRRNPRVDRDLTTICLKCLEKDPQRRYSSAEAVAADLERWLAGEPILARPVGNTERLWRWCRRNPLVAVLLGAVAALLAATVIATTWAATAAGARERVARARAEEALDREQELLVQQLQLVRRGPHVNGWSEQAWKLAAAAADIRRDGLLRKEAAAALAGIDARGVEPLGQVEASSIAIDSTGKRLLLGGTSVWAGTPVYEAAKLWDGTTGQVISSKHRGPGPVAFLGDGTAVQVAIGQGSLVLWDVKNQKPAGECKLDPSPANPPLSFMANDLRYPVLALSPEGPLVAAAIHRQKHDTVAVWQAALRKQLFEVPLPSVSALAFSPRGDLLAAGDKQGRIVLYSVPQGERVASLKGNRMTVHGLAFDHAAGHAPQLSGGASLTGRLATADAGSTVTLWDLSSQNSIAHCHGSGNDVFALAFSPDGMILATGGRGPTRLWDAAGGRLLLQLGSGDHITGLAFSSDGKRLAVSSRNHPFHRGSVLLWDLQFGQGIETLYGLTRRVSKVCFSPDGRRLAALAHNWDVAIWDIDKGHLLRKLEAPRGVSADNAGLAFSHDGRHLGFSARDAARLWDIGTGQVLGSWQLRPGLNDVLAFTPRGKLLSGRVEVRPNSQDQDWRLRELVRPDIARTIAERKPFNGWTSEAMASPDGICFVIKVLQDGRTTAIAFDGQTGAERWSMPLETKLGSYLAQDPEGRLLSIFPHERPGQGILVDMASGKRLGPLTSGPPSLGPRAELLLLGAGGGDRGFSLLRRGEDAPLVVLGSDTSPPPLRSSAATVAGSPGATTTAP
jgi:WD40 repeat protein/tRNA A-37 threonylcarbamoyl transferase component Bud32